MVHLARTTQELEVEPVHFKAEPIARKVVIEGVIRLVVTYAAMDGLVHCQQFDSPLSILLEAPQAESGDLTKVEVSVELLQGELLNNQEIRVKALVDVGVDILREKYVVISIDEPGRNVIISGHRLVNVEEGIFTTTDECLGTPTRDIAQLFVITYFVANLGENPARVFIEISPDTQHWVKEQVE